MIIAFLNTKGGTGKTTSALNAVIGRALQGRNVLAVDGDRQGSLIAALANRGEREPLVAVAQYTDGQTMRQQVTRAKAHYDDIVIDVGGRDNTALRAALLVADKVIIPFPPRSFDVWALDDMQQLLDEARTVKDINAYAFLMMSDPRGTDNASAGEAVPAGIKLLPAAVGRRKAIAEAAGEGLSLLELPSGRDPKALQELQAFISAVFA